MFICERLHLNKYEYSINENHIKEVFLEANKRELKSLVLVQESQTPIEKNVWINIANDFNINLLFAKKVSCFASNMEEKVSFLFIYKDMKEYQIIKKVTKILNSQHIPYLSNESLNYLQRIKQNIFYIDKSVVRNYFTNELAGMNPSVPFNSHELPYFKSLSLNNVCSFDEFFEFQNYDIELKSDWSSIPQLNAESLTLDFDESQLTKLEKQRLRQELEWLKKNNLIQTFWLATQLSVLHHTFSVQNDYNHFVLSYCLGLIDNMPYKLYDLSSNEKANLSYAIEETEKSLFFANLSNILSNNGKEYKFPLSRESLLFSSVLSWFNNTFDKFDVKKVVEYKDLYDDSNEIEKGNFFEDMKLFFLLNSNAEYAFRQALFLTQKNIHRKRHQTEKIVLIDSDEFDTFNEYINLDIEELNQMNYPIISIHIKTLNF